MNHLSSNIFQLLCCTFLLLGSPRLLAQNYYVALVKGEVYYNEKPLKVRDKISLSGNLRFSAATDYIKVSGPKGLHTIGPLKKSGGGYEFLRAVSAELFPAPKPVNSMVLSAWQDVMDILGIHTHNQYMPDFFLEGEKRPISEYLELPSKRLYWVSEAKKRRKRKVIAATLEGGELLLDRENFSYEWPEETAYLFHVDDLPAFKKMVTKTKDLNHLALLLSKEEITQMEMPEQVLRLQAKYGNQPLPARYLSYLRPEQLLSAEPILEEMWFFFQQNPNESIDDFMFSNLDDLPGYEVILAEKYGAMNFLTVAELFERYARERGYEGE